MTRVYVATLDGLLIADEGAAEVDVHFAGSSVEAVAIDPENPDRLYVGLYSGQEMFRRQVAATEHGLCGVWRSDDAGATWQDVSARLAHPATIAVAVRGDGTVYAGSEPSTISISHDGGATWEQAGNMTTLPSAPTWAFPPRSYTHHVHAICFDPTDADRLYVCIEAGALIQSHDDGISWIDRAPSGPFDTHTLATHPLVPGRLYAAAGDGFMRRGHGYAESQDRGESWTSFAEGLQHHYLYGMAVHQADPETVLVSAAASPIQAHDPANAASVIYRRTAGGPWALAMAGLPDPRGTTIPIITAHPMADSVFYAASNRGVFRSDDAGLTWKPAPIPWREDDRFQSVRALVLVA